MPSLGGIISLYIVWRLLEQQALNSRLLPFALQPPRPLEDFPTSALMSPSNRFSLTHTHSIGSVFLEKLSKVLGMGDYNTYIFKSKSMRDLDSFMPVGSQGLQKIKKSN